MKLFLRKYLYINKEVLCFLFFICFLPWKVNEVIAQTPNWVYAKSHGSTGDEIVVASYTDSKGNNYHTGYYSGTTVIGGVTLSSAGASDIFIAKFDAGGNTVWVKSMGGSSSDRGNGIMADDNGNVYVTGYYLSASVTFGTTTVTNAGSRDVFLVKFNADGTPGWINSYGSSGPDEGSNIYVNTNNGDVYVTGNYTSSITIGSTTLTSFGGRDLFVARINNAGTVSWAKGGGSSLDDGTADIMLYSGGIYVSGNIGGNAAFGGLSITSAGGTDICLLRYNATTGNEVYATSAGGTGTDLGGALKIASNGNLNITGSFAGTATFGTAGSKTSNGGTDVFVAQYSTSLNPIWVKSAGGTSNDNGTDLAVDANNNILVSGYFANTITFGSLSSLTSAGGIDAFIVMYNNSGTEQFALKAGGTSTDQGISIGMDENNRMYFAGTYSSSATFGPYSLTSNGATDFFVAALYDGYTWLGTSNSNWNNAANWAPASVPSSSDKVAIYSGPNNPTLNASSVSISNLRFISGTLNLNSYTLTTTGDAWFKGGAINNGSVSSTGNSVTYQGTNFSTPVTANCSNVYFNGSVFNSTVSVTKTGAAGNNSLGGNTFGGVTTITNAGGDLTMANGSNGDVFNTNVTFTRTGTGLFYPCIGGNNYFRGDVTVSGNINFGIGAGSDLIFDGINNQAISVSGTGSFSKMTVNKTSGTISLNSTVSVSALTFVSGANCKINTGANVFKITTVTGASATAYVNGIVQNQNGITGTQFVFPVGTSTTYLPVTLKTASGNNGTGSDQYQIQAFNTPPNSTSLDHIVDYINPFYWNVTKVSGTTSVQLVLPWNSSTPGVIHPQDELVAQYDGNKWKAAGNKNLTIIGTDGSVASFPLSSYGYFTLAYKAPNPDACATCDPTLNWISVRDFDEYGRVINDQRVFADHLGRVKQSQQRNLEEDKILAKTIVYDTYGRPVLSTLPAPLTDANFAFNKSFISTGASCGPSACPYSYQDFDISVNLNNPAAVAVSSPLGKYYSTTSDEAFIATSSYPYSRVDYNNAIIGGVVRGSEPGNAMKMGAGHENKGIVLTAYDELADYMVFKNKYFVNAGTSLDAEVIKSVAKDENGTESITYTDKSGKTIVSCLAGTASLPVTVDIKAKFSTYALIVPANTSFTNIIVESQDVVNVVYSAGGNYTGLASGNPYKEITAGTTLTVSSNKPFSITYNSIAIVSGTTVFTKGKVYSNEQNYQNNSVDIHLQNNHSLSLSQSTSGNSVSIYNLETGVSVYNGTVAGFSSSGIQPGFYRIIYSTQSTSINSNTSAYVTVSYNVHYGNHAYYYYDNAGRLIGQTAPLGVAAGSAGANPSYTSKYTYNSLNWLLSSQDPDRGLTYYVYQKDGRLRFMQDQLQRNNNRFGYINYDNIQRPVETGEYTSSTSPNNLYFQHMLDNYNGVSIPVGYTNIFTSLNAGTAVTGTTNLATVSKMDYDVPFDLSSVRTGYVQRNVNGRVSRSYNEYTTYWYSYDERGRLEWTVQQLTGTAGTTFSSTAADRVKTNNYSYDFRSHLLSVSYQKDIIAERLEHFYSYDAMMCLSKVETKSGNDALTENAEYKYYLHGPLKRKEIGSDLQGMDYVYTINGMLKAINHPNLDGNDPGRDNFSAIPGQEDHSGFYKDVFGMMLEYYDNDYSNGTSYQTTSNLTSAGYQQYYNGVIRSWTWNTRLPVEDPNPNPVQFTYKYDAKYQLTDALFGDHNKTTNAFDAGTGKYNVTGITYDLNGNFITLSRKDQSGVVQTKDNINYVLNAGMNSLSITHSGTLGSPTRTYGYDAIGRMISYTNSIGEKNKYVQYDYTGKVTAVYKSLGTSEPLVSYLYDEKGNKIRKTSYHATTYAITEHTWYINDAAGNVLSVYKTTAGVTSQKEVFVYGTERIGLVNKAGTPEYNYEVKDHLGNVRALIREFNNNLEVLDAADYYPHGGRIPGRGKVGSDQYRYGYQGEWAERNIDLMDEVVDFDLRMYDPTLGRFLTPDPYYQYHSPYMAMHNNPISTIDPDGGNGMGPTGGNSTGGNAGPTGGFGAGGGGGAGAGGGLFQQIGNFFSNLFGGKNNNNGCDHDQKSYQHGGTRAQQQAYQQSHSNTTTSTSSGSTSGSIGTGNNNSITSIPGETGGGQPSGGGYTSTSSGYSGGNNGTPIVSGGNNNGGGYTTSHILGGGSINGGPDRPNGFGGDMPPGNDYNGYNLPAANDIWDHDDAGPGFGPSFIWMFPLYEAYKEFDNWLYNSGGPITYYSITVLSIVVGNESAFHQLGIKAFQTGIQKTLSNPNTLIHIFKSKHGLENLVKLAGSQNNLIRKMYLELGKGTLPGSGAFERIVQIYGQSVTIRGAVVDGIPRISTAFIQSIAK